MNKPGPRTEKSTEPVNTLTSQVEESPKPPKPDPRLASRPRMGKYSNVAEGGEDLLIRIMDWLAGEKSFKSIFKLNHKERNLG